MQELERSETSGNSIIAACCGRTLGLTRGFMADRFVLHHFEYFNPLSPVFRVSEKKGYEDLMGK